MNYYSHAFQLGLLERPSVNTKLGSGKIRRKLRSTAETRAIDNGQQQLRSHNWTEYESVLFSISLLHWELLKWPMFFYYAIVSNNKVGNVRKTLQCDFSHDVHSSWAILTVLHHFTRKGHFCDDLTRRQQ